MFMVHGKKAPDCHGPLAPKGFCKHICTTSSSRRQLKKGKSHDTVTWTKDACEYIHKKHWYSDCIDSAVDSCYEMDADASYVEAESAYVDTDGTAIQGGTQTASSKSYLVGIIAAAVGTMFVGLYVYKKKHDEREELLNADLTDGESFHGSVARRLEQRTTSLPKGQTDAEAQFVDSSGYELA